MSPRVANEPAPPCLPFDVWFLATNFDIDADVLRQAIVHTFQRRGTPLPWERPLPLTDIFTKSLAKQTQWKAFVTKSGLGSVAPSLDRAGGTIWALVGQALH